MITVDGRAVLVVAVTATGDDDRIAATKSTMLRESTGRVMFVESGPADVHIVIRRGELRIDAVGISERAELSNNAADDIATIEHTVGMLARRLNQHLTPTAG